MSIPIYVQMMEKNYSLQWRSQVALHPVQQELVTGHWLVVCNAHKEGLIESSKIDVPEQHLDRYCCVFPKKTNTVVSLVFVEHQFSWFLLIRPTKFNLHRSEKINKYGITSLCMNLCILIKMCVFFKWTKIDAHEFLWNPSTVNIKVFTYNERCCIIWNLNKNYSI